MDLTENPTPTPNHNPEETGSLRLFLAIPLPEDTLRQVADIRQRLMKGFVFTTCRATWVSPEALHLTMRFLGQTPVSQIPELISKLGESISGGGPIRIKPKGLGVFPNWRQPKVLWVGMENLTGELDQLHRRVEAVVGAMGFQPDRQEFHPHVTLARFKSAKGIEAAHKIVNSHRLFMAPIFTADKLVLFSSQLGPDGPKYRVIHALTI